MCLGHESSGIVAKLGPDVKSSLGLKEGMRVALEPGVSCRTCGSCKAGAYEVGRTHTERIPADSSSANT